MSRPKLITALDVLTQEEWHSFRKYLLRYTRENSDNFKCFQKLYDQRKLLMKEGLDEKLRLQHFPQMSPKVYSNLLSRLFTWFEDWFAIETFKSQKHDKALMLVKGYNQRGLFKLANQHFRRLKKKINTAESINAEHQEALSKLYTHQYFSNNPIKKSKESNFLQDSVDQFLINITEQSLMYLLEIENSSKSKSTEYAQSKAKIVQILKTKIDSKLSTILHTAIKLFNSDDLDAFYKLKGSLESKEIEESSDLFLILSIYLRRSSILFWHQDIITNPHILLDVFDLSFYAIEKNNHQKFLASNLFNGVETIGYVLDFAQTEIFIYKWINKVHTKYSKSTLQFCKALNDFRHDKYDKLPSLLIGLHFDELSYKLLSNCLLIIAHYKLGEEQLVITLSQNFKNQLRRNKSSISSFVFVGLNNLIDIILLFQKSKYNKKVNIELSNYNPIYYKSWVTKELDV